MQLKLSLFFVLLISILGFGQQHSLSNNAEISVLTFGPGTSLNDAFGHNAFRVKDVEKGIDLVYGYGQYDFDAPNFYLKFARGKLNYLISRHRFSDIYSYYSGQNRSIKAQILNLNTNQKHTLFKYLEDNYKPENRKYLYDFFYDNCATKIRDVSQLSTHNVIDFKLPKNFEQKTFRTLIHEHVNLNSWGSFGIDIALGSVVDRAATANEFMFLPKYIHLFFDNAKLNESKSLVTSSTVLFKPISRDRSSNFIFSPLAVFSLIAILILYITYRDFKNKRLTKRLDLALLSITGSIGVLLLFLWFGTDHSATVQNYNLLWAFPLNILAAFELLKPKVKNWVKRYVKFLIIMLCLLTMHWLIGVQIYAIGLIPFLMALIVRYFYVYYFLKLQ